MLQNAKGCSFFQHHSFRVTTFCSQNIQRLLDAGDHYPHDAECNLAQQACYYFQEGISRVSRILQGTKEVCVEESDQKKEILNSVADYVKRIEKLPLHTLGHIRKPIPFHGTTKPSKQELINERLTRMPIA